MFTLFHMGRYEDVIERGQGLDGLIKVDGLMRLGRLNNAIEASREAEHSPGVPAVAKMLFVYMRAVAEGDAAGISATDDRPRVERARDPEFHFWWAGFAVRVGDLDYAPGRIQKLSATRRVLIREATWDTQRFLQLPGKGSR